DLVSGTPFLSGLSGEEIKVFLFAAGILDVLSAGLIFSKKLRSPALAYMVIWGFLTALARLVANVEWNFLSYSLTAYLPMVIIRMPHALIPGFFFMQYRRVQKHEVRRELVPSSNVDEAPMRIVMDS